MEKAEKRRKLRHFKEMQKDCNGKHPAHIINANPNLLIDLDACLEKEIGVDVLSVLHKLAEGVYNRCPNCGGITSRDCLLFSRKELLFYLHTNRRQRRKSIAETDYTLMEDFLQALKNNKGKTKS